MFNELKGIHDKGTFIPVLIADLSSQEASKILPSKLFLKEKFSPTKVYEKYQQQHCSQLQESQLKSDGRKQCVTLVQHT
jgi:hypothetical protein